MIIVSIRPLSVRNFRSLGSFLPVIGWLLVLTLLMPQTGFGSESLPLSPRNASYEIEVQLDPDERSLTGSQVLTWRNIQDQPTSELWFHLYWNGWRNDRSTWMLESGARRRNAKSPRGEDWAFMEVDEVRLLATEQADLPRAEAVDGGGFRR